MIRSLIIAATAALLSVGASAHAGDPINANCPIGKEPIVASAGTIEYKGDTIGLCCPGCGKAFLAWDEARRDAFVVAAKAGTEPGSAHAAHDDPPAAVAPAVTHSPITLDTCIVSGKPLGSMGDPVVFEYEGRTVRLCCAACTKSFEANPAKLIEKQDAAIIAQERKHYPIDTCIVAGGKLGSMGDPVDHLHHGRLVRFCCAACIPTFEKDPAMYLAKLDAQIIAQQTKSYPLETCVVAGGKLGSMGDPVNHIAGNRLVRFCCASCIAQFDANPAKYLAQLDTAYADAQRASYPLDTCVVAGGKLGSMGEPDEIIAGTTLVRFCCKACRAGFDKDPAKHLATIHAARS